MVLPERYTTAPSPTGHSVGRVNEEQMDFFLDAIRDAFNDATAEAERFGRVADQMMAELRQLEALSGKDEYIISEEIEPFD